MRLAGRAQARCTFGLLLLLLTLHTPEARAQNEIVVENALTGNPASEWDVSGAGDSSIQGFATNISYAPGETAQFKVSTPSTKFRIDLYRLGWYAGLGARKVATVPSTATVPHIAAGLPRGRLDRPRRLRQLGRVGVVDRARQRRLRDLRGAAGARGPGKRGQGEPRRVRGPRRHRRLRHPVPDFGYDLAGVQPVRRQQPVRRRAGHQPGARVQGQLQPAVHDPRHRSRGLGVQRRVPDGALARAQRLRRQLLDRRRHRSARRGAARAQRVPLGRPRRVLVGRAARERRGGARRRREPRPSSPATRCSGRRAGSRASTAAGPPTGRSSPTRRPTRTRRSTR